MLSKWKTPNQLDLKNWKYQKQIRFKNSNLSQNQPENISVTPTLQGIPNQKKYV